MAQLTKEGYLAELIDIRAKLVDFLDLIEKGKTSYFKDVSTKLRILYCPKGGERHLISELEELFNFKVNVLIRYTVQESVEKGLLPASLANGLVFHQVNSPITWFDRGDELISLDKALEHKEILYDGNYFSYKTIVEVLADKMGGAHVDKNVKDEDLALHIDTFLIGGLPIAERAIFDLSRATIRLIDLILDFINKGQTNNFITKK